MTPSSGSALFLGYATAIATFSAAAVALGLLYCVNKWQQAVSVLVLLFAMLGIASSLIALAKQHTMVVLNVAIALGFVTTAGYVLFAALSVVFTDPDAHDEGQHGYWLWLYKKGGVAGKPRTISFSACVVMLIGLFVIATPSLLKSLTQPQPLTTPPQSRSTQPQSLAQPQSVVPTYSELCGKRHPLGWPAPSPQADALRGLWHGPSGVGAILAGCPQAARREPGHPALWFVNGMCEGQLSSFGVANAHGGSALLFGQAARFAHLQAIDGSLLSATKRLLVDGGDIYLVGTIRGTTALVHRLEPQHSLVQIPQSCVESDRFLKYTIVPPPLVSLWIQMMHTTGWAWPIRAGLDNDGTHFVFVTDRQSEVVAVATCRSFNDCALSRNGETVHSTAEPDITIKQIVDTGLAGRVP